MLRQLRRIKTAIKLLVPSPYRRRYERVVKSSGMFDKAFYLGTYRQLHWLSKLLPLRHYILLGEKLGLHPNPEFSPMAYLYLNEDVKALNTAPLLHYATIGKAENRLTRDISTMISGSALASIPIIRPDDGPDKPEPFAIYVHIYYADLWPEFARLIKKQTFGFDLFVTCTTGKGHDEKIIEKVKHDFPDATVFSILNHGRDIFPFIHLVNSGIFEPYKAVCKLHTKKSPHRPDGAEWRQHLTDGVLGDPTQTHLRLKQFIQLKNAAFWVADGQFFDNVRLWGPNEATVTKLMRRLEYRIDPTNLSFPAGSIYWVKPIVLEMLRGLQLTHRDFHIEQGEVDGTMAHAIERALGYIVKAADMSVLQASELDENKPEITVDYSA